MTSNIVSSLILTGLVGFVIAGVIEYVVPRGKSTGSDDGIRRQPSGDQTRVSAAVRQIAARSTTGPRVGSEAVAFRTFGGAGFLGNRFLRNEPNSVR